MTAYSINRLTIICAFSSMNYKWRRCAARRDAMRMYVFLSVAATPLDDVIHRLAVGVTSVPSGRRGVVVSSHCLLSSNASVGRRAAISSRRSLYIDRCRFASVTTTKRPQSDLTTMHSAHSVTRSRRHSNRKMTFVYGRCSIFTIVVCAGNDVLPK